MYIRLLGTTDSKIYFRHNLAVCNTLGTMCAADASTSIGYSSGKFFNLRLEAYDVADTDGAVTTIIKIFGDNTYVTEINAGKQLDFNRISIGMTSGQRENTSDAYFKFDNVYLGIVDKAYVTGDPNASAEG